MPRRSGKQFVSLIKLRRGSKLHDETSQSKYLNRDCFDCNAHQYVVPGDLDVCRWTKY